MLTDQLRHWSHGHHGHHWSPGTQAGYLSFQWSKWAGKKNLRKNLVFWPTFFFDQFHKTHWSPWSPQVTWYTGRLSQLPVVKMSWGKNSKKKPSVLTKFLFLINFIRHTGPRVTMVTKGHQAHRQAISAFSGQNELGEKFIVFSGNGCCGGVGKEEWLILRLILMLLVKNGLIYTRTIVILDLLLWLKSFWC